MVIEVERQAPSLRKTTAAGLERQTAFGWTIAWAVFLGGAGAGAFLVSYILDVLNRYEPIARIGALLGPVAVIICTLCLLADLAVRVRFRRLFANFSSLSSSWMSRGVWILTVFIVFALAYSLPSFQAFAWLPWSKATTLGSAFGIIAALFSILVAMYTGFLFSAVKSIPFWNVAVLPLLFVISSLCSGIALVILIALGFVSTLGQEIITAFHVLGLGEIVLILMQLLTLWAFLGVALHGNISSKESVRLIKVPIAGVIIGGLLIPLGLLLYDLGVSDISAVSTLSGLGGVLELSGGLFLRYSILNAGVFLVHT